MPPTAHALITASGAHRWLICSAAPRFEAQFPAETTVYAEEGTLAHSLGELKLQKKFLGLNARTYTSRFNKIKKDELYTDEMDKATDLYLDCVAGQYLAYNSPPSVAVEVRVDLSSVIMEGFGTCDCCLIGDDTLSIVDLKFGRGVAVESEGNPQMRLYALGALNRYQMIYGDTIRQIKMTICQPRISSEPSTAIMSTEDLLAWGQEVKVIADKAYNGQGEFVPGDHCRFCRGKAQCKARADYYSAANDFADAVPVNLLTDDKIGELLTRFIGLPAWYSDLQDYAAKQLLAGHPIPGWKIVEGRSVRAFSDQDAALQAVIDAGYDEAMVYERVPKSLAKLEKMMGKADFSDKLSDYVIKPPGKPTLAPESDKRPAYSPAAADFAEVANG